MQSKARKAGTNKKPTPTRAKAHDRGLLEPAERSTDDPSNLPWRIRAAVAIALLASCSRSAAWEALGRQIAHFGHLAQEMDDSPTVALLCEIVGRAATSVSRPTVRRESTANGRFRVTQGGAS